MPKQSHSDISMRDRGSSNVGGIGQQQRAVVMALPPRPSSASRPAPSASTSARQAAEAPARRAVSRGRPGDKETRNINPGPRSHSSSRRDASAQDVSVRSRGGSSKYGAQASIPANRFSTVGRQGSNMPSNARPFSSSSYGRGDVVNRGGFGSNNRATVSRLKRAHGQSHKTKTRPSELGYFYHSKDETEFYVCGKGLNDEEAGVMAPAFASARVLNLCDNAIGVAPQPLPRGIEALDLSKNGIAVLPAPALRGLSVLRELYLGGNGLERMYGIASAVSIEVLDLSFNKLEFVEGLETLSNLNKLNLKANRISEQFGLRSLSFNRKLVLLDVSENDVVLTQGFRYYMLSIIPQLEGREKGRGGVFALRKKSVQYQKVHAHADLPEFPELIGPGMLWTGLPGYWDGETFHRSAALSAGDVNGQNQATYSRLFESGSGMPVSPPPLPSPSQLAASPFGRSTSRARSPSAVERALFAKNDIAASLSVSPTKQRPARPRQISKKSSSAADDTPAAPPTKTGWRSYYKPTLEPKPGDDSARSRKLKQKQLTIYSTDEPATSEPVEYTGDRSRNFALAVPPTLPAEETFDLSEVGPEEEEGEEGFDSSDEYTDASTSYSVIYLRNRGQPHQQQRQEPTRPEPSFQPRQNAYHTASIQSPGGVMTRVVPAQASSSGPGPWRSSLGSPTTPDSISPLPSPVGNRNAFLKGNRDAQQDSNEENDGNQDADPRPSPSHSQQPMRGLTGNASSDASELRSTLLKLLEHKRSVVNRLRSPAAAASAS